MNSLQVESLFTLYERLSKDEKLNFLTKIDKNSSDFREAALVIELDRNKIVDPMIRHLIQKDIYLQKEIIIEQNVVSYIESQIKNYLSEVKFVRKRFENFNGIESWAYTFLEFDPNDDVKRKNEEEWKPFILEFEPFDINNLDWNIGSMFWKFNDIEGYQYEIEITIRN